RSCLAPDVALFENQSKIFRRTRQLMREDSVIHVLAGLFFLFALVLGALIPIPRLVLFSNVFESEWTRIAEDSIWAFELICGVVLTTGLAVGWSVALTLFYYDLRQYREGERIARKVAVLRDAYDHLHRRET